VEGRTKGGAIDAGFRGEDHADFKGVTSLTHWP
jgi:hypothetical protein